MESLGFVAVAVGVVLFALVSRRLESSVVTPPMVFAVFGLAIGSAGLGWLEVGDDMESGHGFVHGLAEITLILVLFSDAARIDLRALKADHNLPVRMLVIGMPLAIIAGTAVALLLPLGLSLWEAALLAALMAPTDAALGQAVVSNPKVPARIRQALNVEGGLNDGIALPLVFLFACLAGAAHSVEDINWATFAGAQLGFGPLAGIVIGGAGAWALDTSALKGWISETYEGLAMLAIAFLSFAGAELIGGNGFIAAFVAGLVFGNFLRDRCRFVFEFAEAEGQLLVLLVFMVFGAALLPEAIGALNSHGWAAVVFAVLALTLVRMVPVAVALAGTGLRWQSILFLGWFGPRGLASILFALFVLEQVTMGLGHMILSITVMTVAISIFAHGITAAPLARLYGTYIAREKSREEMMPVSEMPTRAKAASQMPNSHMPSAD